MSEPIVEIVLWVLLAFFVGCIIGYLFRSTLIGMRSDERNGRGEAAQFEEPGEVELPEEKSETASSDVAVQVPAARRRTAGEPVKTSALNSRSASARSSTAKMPKASAANNGQRPKGIPAPRAGSPDELQRISGVGPKIELSLHRMGIFHFDQIAAWTAEQEQWVDDQLKFRGRIGRDEWVKQAKLLVQGKEEEFATLYGGGAAAPKKPPKSRTNSRKSPADRADR